jgi:hypothetical protein
MDIQDCITPRSKQRQGKAGKPKTKTATGGSSCPLDRRLHDPSLLSSTVLSFSFLANQWPGPAFASCTGSRVARQGHKLWMSG